MVCEVVVAVRKMTPTGGESAGHELELVDIVGRGHRVALSRAIVEDHSKGRAVTASIGR